MKNPKNKGNNFERQVAKIFSDWAGVKFMRTPASGAIHNFKDKRVVSDIVPPLSIGKFPFSIECKKVECSWEISSILEGTSQTIENHWFQCLTDADREGLIPLLVFSKNFRGIYGVMKQVDFVATKVKLNKYLEVYQNDMTLVIFNLKDFLTSISCTELIALNLN